MKNKTTRKVLLLALVLVQAWFVNAQNFQGIATYHSATKLKLQFAGPNGESMITDDIKKQLNKQMQKEFKLRFNLTESTWEEAASLDGSQPTAASAGGGAVIRIGGGQKGILYKNTAEGKYEEEEDIFGKPFLVKDKLQPYEWQLTGETKKIGNYNCQQAIYEKIETRKSFKIMSGDYAGEGSGLEEVQDTVTVTAWFTPDIPVSHGPEDYWGLPGLILEVNNGTTTLVCSKVVLNPEDGVELEMPAKGKVVSRNEFSKIQEEKVQEMMNKYSGGGSGPLNFRSGGGQ